MFFLIRAMFWICVVLLMMPQDERPQAAGTKAVAWKSPAIVSETAPIAKAALLCAKDAQSCRSDAEAAARVGSRLGAAAGALSTIWRDLTDPTPTGSLERRQGASRVR
jgi:hypothetical protein